MEGCGREDGLFGLVGIWFVWVWLFGFGSVCLSFSSMPPTQDSNPAGAMLVDYRMVRNPKSTPMVHMLHDAAWCCMAHMLHGAQAA